MRLLTCLAVISFVVMSRAAAAPASSKRWITSAPCVEMCGVIESCAEKAKRPELGRLLCHIASCEIGKFCGRKEVRSPSGAFHGPFQFIPGTWKSVCQPFFKEQGIAGCSGKKAIYDTCCTSMCAAEIVASELNGGIRNWPKCGPAAKRSVAAEQKGK